jgi:2-dehydropantoate 2-reductase
MRFVVVGAGGVGGLLGALLARGGSEVAFVARGASLAALAQSGLSLESSLGTFRVKVLAAEDPAALGKADAILVAVKSWQVLEVAPRLAPLVGDSTVVVPLQNGVEAAAQLAGALGERPVLGGLCWLFAWMEGPGRTRHVGGAPRVTLGERRGGTSARVERVCSVMQVAGIEATVSSDIECATWEKFLFLDPFGSVGSVTRVGAGAFRTLPEPRALLEAAVREVEALARARGVRLKPDAATRALAQIDTVAPDATASMQRDIVAGRQSELLELTGAVVRLARESGVDVPVHRFMLASLLPQELAARRAAAR